VALPRGWQQIGGGHPPVLVSTHADARIVPLRFAVDEAIYLVPALLLPKTPSMLVGAVVRVKANVVRDSARAMGKRCGIVMDRAAATGLPSA
jgi:hypothetical protein